MRKQPWATARKVGCEMDKLIEEMAAQMKKRRKAYDLLLAYALCSGAYGTPAYHKICVMHGMPEYREGILVDLWVSDLNRSALEAAKEAGNV